MLRKCAKLNSTLVGTFVIQGTFVLLKRTPLFDTIVKLWWQRPMPDGENHDQEFWCLSSLYPGWNCYLALLYDWRPPWPDHYEKLKKKSFKNA